MPDTQTIHVSQTAQSLTNNISKRSRVSRWETKSRLYITWVLLQTTGIPYGVSNADAAVKSVKEKSTRTGL
ncbi:hypothetical protein SmJEL517_g02958 [Synchytrium microbalum]|uniref:Uncharacterized protein n=1 Tax=Synchytrium microbalum TaxID=1806994 RepID=A0A507CA66_9FUNG|nr:uncharacterized protein SmJEL517_g02958 [Synchytrium microbalum]TPX34395.1 hypothetical protein SmJEL517_g02958 [Synchytrium microbalum]